MWLNRKIEIKFVGTAESAEQWRVFLYQFVAIK